MKKLTKFIIPIIPLSLLANYQTMLNKNGVSTMQNSQDQRSYLPKGARPIEDKSYLIREYQEMFQKISQRRIGLEESEIESVPSPFVKVVKKKKKNRLNKKGSEAKKSLALEAIFGKKVMINGKWYRLYQNIGDLKIIYIKGDSVWLKGPTQKIKLSIRNKNEKIIIK